MTVCPSYMYTCSSKCHILRRKDTVFLRAVTECDQSSYNFQLGYCAFSKLACAFNVPDPCVSIQLKVVVPLPKRPWGRSPPREVFPSILKF